MLIINIIITKQANSEEFIFESEYIELKDNGNIIEARDGVKISGKNNIQITANSSLYNKINSELLLKGNVKFYDKIKEIKISSEEIVYKANIEIIETVGKTSIILPGNFIINTKNLKYLKKNDTIQSKFKTTLIDKVQNQISATNFKYLINKKLFHGNNIAMLDKDLNNYFFEKSMIDLNQNIILAKDVEINFAKNIFGNLENDPRLRGSSLSAVKEKTTIKNAVFTTCKINDSCPPWTIKSSEITHNKIKKTINYENAWLQIYDKPILYFPKFFHPDPTVNRQSGFLKPGILSSSSSGSSIMLPYYKVLSANKDLTITPRIYAKGDLMIQNEFRQVEKNYKNIVDFSVKNTSNSFKSHFFSNSKLNLAFDNFDETNLEINLERTSNDTYLKTDNIETAETFNNSLLNSFIELNATKKDLDILLNFQVYEDLSKIKKSNRYEYIYPNFTINKLLETSLDKFGDFEYQVTGFQKKYDTNVSEKSLINNLTFLSRPFFSKSGIKNDFVLLFKNSNRDGKNSSNYKDELSSDFYSSLIFNSYYPMKKKTNSYDRELIPKISLRFNPSRSQNLTDLDRRINYTNIFSNNRLGLTDSLEGGQSLTIGSEYNLNRYDGLEILKMNFGQIFKDTNDKNLPIKSKMNTKSSDLVGEIIFTPNNYLNLDYDFSIDNSLNSVNYSMLKTTFTINNFITSFEFLEENKEIGTQSYLSNETSFAVNKNNKLLFRQRNNRETNLKEFYNLMYQYENDCLVAAIEYKKDYYTDRDLKPTEEIFFSLTIVPLAKLNTPSFSK